jgi:hypothetical protein
MNRNTDLVDFEACCCFVFDECWTIKTTAFGASGPIEACAGNEASFTR